MKKLLIFVQYFEPAYKAGGPVRSIKAFVDNLSSYYDITIITGDRDIGEKESFNILLNKIIKKDKYKICYCTNSYLLKNLAKIIKKGDPDVLYLNSYFSFNFSIYVSLLSRFGIINNKIKIILAPRGEFAKSAISLKGKISELKKLKKKAFLFFVKLLNVHKNVIFHATSISEEKDINRIYSNKQVKVFKAENFSIKYERNNIKKRTTNNSLKVVFLSRINKIKNLNFAIKVLNALKIDIQFDIY